MHPKKRFEMVIPATISFLMILLVGGVQTALAYDNELQVLEASDGGVGETFGNALSHEGDWLAVGAVLKGDFGYGTGAVYLFRRDDNNTPLDQRDDRWIETTKLLASDAEGFQWFGSSLDLTNGRLIVGAFGDDTQGISAGAAYVFRHLDNGTPGDLTDDSWIQEGKLLVSDPQDSDQFGLTIAIDGSWAIGGVTKDDEACGGSPDCNSGAAYIFRLDDNNTPEDDTDDHWVQHAKIMASDAVQGELFGASVSIDGDRAAIGANKDNDLLPKSGSAYIFRRDDNGTPDLLADDVWIEEAKLLASDGTGEDLFGSSIAIQGDRVVVGAPFDDDACGFPTCDSGSAYVFRLDDNGTPTNLSDDTWVEESKLTAFDGARNDTFGTTLSIQGDRIIVGVPVHSDAASRTGTAYVFTRLDNHTPSDPTDDTWILKAKVTASDAERDDFFGSAVAVAGDTVFVGIQNNDDLGTQSGSVYFFVLGVSIIPALSTWNMMVMVLITMVVGTVVLRTHSRPGVNR